MRDKSTICRVQAEPIGSQAGLPPSTKEVQAECPQSITTAGLKRSGVRAIAIVRV